MESLNKICFMEEGFFFQNTFDKSQKYFVDCFFLKQ